MNTASSQVNKFPIAVILKNYFMQNNFPIKVIKKQ